MRKLIIKLTIILIDVLFSFQYWAIFAVLVAGSFIIPMAQYYWYVAEED